MQISAIQHRVTGSANEMQTKKMPNSLSEKKDFTTDSFSKEKGNNISFKGENAVKGGLWGMIGGSLLAVGAIVVTGGAALPFAATYFGATLGGTALGTAIGHAVDKKSNER